MDNMNLQNNGMNQPGKADGMGIASLVLGIVSIVMSCCITYIGLGCGIVGVILGVMSNQKNKNGITTAGIVCSIIGIVLSIILIIIGIVFGEVLTELLYKLLYSM